MPQQPPIDYDALAAAVSKDVDYDAIAQEAIASAVSPKPPSKSWGERATNALPTIGGMAGGLLGGSKISPVGMALAGIGGAGGEAFKQVADAVRGDFSEVPDTVGGRLRKIGIEGLKQGGMEGGGRVVGRVVQPVAKALYGYALRPSVALMRDAGGGKLIQGLKRIVDQGFGDNVLPSGLGLARAGKLVSQSADEATALAAKSPQTAITQRVMQRATDDQARRSVGELVGAGITPKTDQIASQIGNLIDSNPANVSMKQLLEMRRGAESVAAPAFKAAKVPGGAAVETGSKASVARSISGAAKQTLDDVLGQAFKDVNARTQARMAVKQAVDTAASRPNMLTNLVAGGVGVAGAQGDLGQAAKNSLLLRLLMSPTMQGGAALAAGKLPYAQLIRAAELASRDDD
jgi:hypothetical protein